MLPPVAGLDVVVIANVCTAKFAVTDFADVTFVSWQAPVPEQSPDQLAKE